jgi:hypothetical protein
MQYTSMHESANLDFNSLNVFKVFPLQTNFIDIIMVLAISILFIKNPIVLKTEINAICCV